MEIGILNISSGELLSFDFEAKGIWFYERNQLTLVYNNVLKVSKIQLSFLVIH